MDRQALSHLATADGHDRHVPTGSKDFLSAGHEGVYEWVVEHLVRDGGLFLDVGCGTGYASTTVAAAGARYDGVDSSPAAIDYAQTNYARPGVRFYVADLLGALPSALLPRSYDVVCSSEVIEHVVDPFALVGVMAELVRDDGVCFVGTPNRLWSRDHMPGGALLSRSHVMEFTPAALRALLGTAFSDVTLLYRMFPGEAISSTVVPASRSRLARAALAFAREVAPHGVDRCRNGSVRRKPGRAWSSRDILWLEEGDSRLEPPRCVGLAAVCRAPRR